MKKLSKITEGVIGDIIKRAASDEIRAEEDVNGMNLSEFENYLNDRYKIILRAGLMESGTVWTTFRKGKLEGKYISCMKYIGQYGNNAHVLYAEIPRIYRNNNSIYGNNNSKITNVFISKNFFEDITGHKYDWSNDDWLKDTSNHFLMKLKKICTITENENYLFLKDKNDDKVLNTFYIKILDIILYEIRNSKDIMTVKK